MWTRTHSSPGPAALAALLPSCREELSVSLLATSQKLESTVVFVQKYRYIFECVLSFLQQALIIYRRLASCRIPNIPVSWLFFLVWGHLPSGQVGAHKRVCQRSRSTGETALWKHWWVSFYCWVIIRVWTSRAAQRHEACRRACVCGEWISVLLTHCGGTFHWNPPPGFWLRCFVLGSCVTHVRESGRYSFCPFPVQASGLRVKSFLFPSGSIDAGGLSPVCLFDWSGHGNASQNLTFQVEFWFFGPCAVG